MEQYYVLGRILGRGAFSVVRLATCIADGSEWACKIIDKRALAFSKESLRNEIAMLKKANHPNVIRLREMFETDKRVYLIMEYCGGGELFEAIIQKEKYAEVDAARLMYQMLDCVRELHELGIVHRDLKPENVLLSSRDDDAFIKIADFGLSKLKTPGANMQTACGTPGYVAPEVLKCVGYGPEVDIWSSAVIMYILLCGFPPFYEETTQLLFEQIQAGKYEFTRPYWDVISDEAKDLIRKMLVVDPTKRISVKDCLAHPWFKNQHATQIPTFHGQLVKFNAKMKLKRAMIAVHAATVMQHLLGRLNINVECDARPPEDD